MKVDDYSQIMEKIKSVWNHQPVTIVYDNYNIK